MKARNIWIPAVAIITLLLVACSGGGDTLSVAKIGSPDPTGTAAPTPAATAELELGLGGFEDIDLGELIQEVKNSPELMGCLRISMSILSLIEMSEGYDPDIEMALILPCFSEDQIDSIFDSPSDLLGPPEPFAASEPIPVDAASS